VDQTLHRGEAARKAVRTNRFIAAKPLEKPCGPTFHRGEAAGSAVLHRGEAARNSSAR
jgi:hypothetical protein